MAAGLRDGRRPPSYVVRGEDESPGNAAADSFVPRSDDEPGFEWISAPPDGISCTPVVSQGSGNQLTITDLDNSTYTQGSWTYMLRVKVGGSVYSTKTLSLKATTTNPVIVNK
jgi:hypothetical protein